ncbi:hypothetical protein GW17_00018690 [Ensete ventricosum]|uniref:Uncharacterized protein n=1 Tax=Ensete ventricosum TaxID=4639 RepID=A0A426ZQ27_ENSVE|nr:hypothetical protein B296_00025967 [Ensete ventricosum]RWW17381.1 hypothetical protein GW17_00018690 [Ensete ventricosum]RZS08425.1 hypothetical protein BHM03_00039396 [Ensete ventricosum]
MVTDRVSTVCLLAVLSQLYRPGLIFLALLGLDIASHWLQMYSSFLSGKTSHKDVKDSTSWLFKLYYGNRMFMAFCCVGCEVLYIILYLLADEKYESLFEVSSLLLLGFFFVFFLFETLQLTLIFSSDRFMHMLWDKSHFFLYCSF